MTTADGALALLRARLEASDSGILIPLRWQAEDGGPLPEVPETFAFVVFTNDGPGGGPVAFGGGRGANLYRNSAFLEAWVFSPNGEGMVPAMQHAETIAARLRSYREGDVSCFSAGVIPIGEGSKVAPPGLASEVNNYVCALAEVALTFDQVG